MFNLNVAAWCLMETHYHLLVQTPDANLARCMRHINGVYTQKYNARHGCDGTLFRGRYKSILVDADNYLLELVRYIHRNPLRAGLVEKLSQYKRFVAKQDSAAICAFFGRMTLPSMGKHCSASVRSWACGATVL